MREAFDDFLIMGELFSSSWRRLRGFWEKFLRV
jgi:hypothetical protein